MHKTIIKLNENIINAHFEPTSCLPQLPQNAALVFDLSLTFDTPFMSHHLAPLTDFLIPELQFICEYCSFTHIDQTLEALTAYIFTITPHHFPLYQITFIDIQLKKALKNQEKVIARCRKTHSDIPSLSEQQAFGTVDIAIEEKDYGIYILNIFPSRSIPPHVHNVMSEHELVMTEGLTLQGKPVKAGTARSWPAGFVHTYHNPRMTIGRLLCIDQPKFIPDDEIIVQNVTGTLQDLPAKSFYTANNTL